MSGDDEGAENPEDTNEVTPAGSAEDAVAGKIPIDGQALMLAAAKASIPGSRLPTLVARAQEYLGDRLDEYRQQYERFDSELEEETGDAAVFLVPDGHWEELGEQLDLDRREVDALRRAHEQHFRRIASKHDRRSEADTALDIREAVVIGTQSN